ncbi:MAG: phosphate transport system regulatory protein PhoU, partial [Gammaproteobacteria bacterium]|nr:phosphate transport system regulatory protein PhoU [Gammaproteobacteria bacterium]NIO63662.1 phosphate transport system regulatory protein PhoU [Gammaproteobacteria bacterium]NIT41679.1 phosphate transport system regulatory protein PhoU [Gammaproteobacteria bacterium]
DIPRMSRIAQGMVRDSIDAFIREDVKLAKDVIMRDDDIDELNGAIWEELM